MHDRDLILGVLATQAGFVTLQQVEAAAAFLSGSGPRSLLTCLEQSGALTPARRELIEALADEALAARQGVDDVSDAELHLDDPVQDATLSYDGKRIAVVSFATVSVWAIGDARSRLAGRAAQLRGVGFAVPELRVFSI